MANLSLTPAADVTYTISSTAAPRRGFDLGLIIGPSEVINPTTRVVVYASLTEMTDAGFATNSIEYLAATKYFASPSNPTQIALGTQESGETPLQALTACRSANSEWYIAYCPLASNADHLEIADYVEAVTPYSMYFINNDDSEVLADDTGNLFASLKAGKYRRTLGQYSTVSHAVASIMGYAMGQTSDAANTAYTLKFKQEPGVTPENLTEAQVSNIEDNYGNVYITRGHFYTWFENGNTFDAGWFDETIYLDKLANEMQLNVADILYQNAKIPQTENGMARLKTVCAQACDKLVDIGFIAPGQWNGGDILTLKTGDYLPAGYLILSDSINGQSQSDRDARIAPTIYVPIKLAGAVHSVLIKIQVNR